MKTISILIIAVLVSVLASAQDIPPHNIQEIEVIPPKFKSSAIIEQKNDLQKIVASYIALPNSSYIMHEGTAVIQFTVNPSGKLSDFKVVNGISHHIDNELIAALRQTDYMWEPGKQNGNPAAMEKEFAMVFRNGNTDTKSVAKDFTRIASYHFKSATKKLFVKNNPKKALRKYNEAARYLPYDQSTLTMIALCQLELGNEVEAQAYIDRIKKIGGADFKSQNLAENVKNLNSYPQLVELLATR